MIFDPDHMSVLARNQALNLVESEDYSGIISSHSWSTDDALPRIYALGGMVTPYAGGSDRLRPPVAAPARLLPRGRHASTSGSATAPT